jgi:hypothetical protein
LGINSRGASTGTPAKAAIPAMAATPATAEHQQNHGCQQQQRSMQLRRFLASVRTPATSERQEEWKHEQPETLAEACIQVRAKTKQQQLEPSVTRKPANQDSTNSSQYQLFERIKF